MEIQKILFRGTQIPVTVIDGETWYGFDHVSSICRSTRDNRDRLNEKEFKAIQHNGKIELFVNRSGILALAPGHQGFIRERKELVELMLIQIK